MNTITDLEGTRLLRSAAQRSAAQDVLQSTDRTIGLPMAFLSVACTAATFALLAARPEPMFHALVGGVAGAALSLGALAFGESRRLSRRIEAVIAVARSEA
jgi:phosphate/sulfate permease